MQSLSIFVHCASEYLTDYKPHGDGLICFSLLNGLAKYSHHIFAYTRYAAISQKSPHLQARTGGYPRVPFGSLVSWEHSWRADQWFLSLSKRQNIDLVWRMHPYGTGCPTVPKTLNKPLIVGPLFYGWPDNKAIIAKPRFGIGLQGLVSPLAQQGWCRTLQAASLILCATPKHAVATQKQFPQTQVLHLPVIVDPPPLSLIRKAPDESSPLCLIFVANLVSYKNPLVFCQIIKLLRDAGIPVTGRILGEGAERPVLEAYCALHELEDIVCLHGQVPNSKVYHYLQDSDLLISTSLGEPYGRGIVEAMSVGVPCICHNSGGPAEIIEHEVNGLLVQELHAKAFADTIALVYTNRQLWQRLFENAISKAKGWTSEAVLSRLEQALLQICHIRSS